MEKEVLKDLHILSNIFENLGYTKEAQVVNEVFIKVAKKKAKKKKNVPTNPSLWASCKAWAKRTFDVYPSAYANGAAAKRYKSKGGGWKKASSDQNVKIAQTQPLDISGYVPKIQKDFFNNNIPSDEMTYVKSIESNDTEVQKKLTDYIAYLKALKINTPYMTLEQFKQANQALYSASLKSKGQPWQYQNKVLKNMLDFRQIDGPVYKIAIEMTRLRAKT